MVKLRGIIVTEDIEEMKNAFRVWEENIFEIVAYVNNGFDCLKLLITEKVDFVLTDAFMSVMDGFVLADMMKNQSDGDTPPLLYFMSTIRDEFYVTRAVNVGANYYFIKPFNVDAFFRVIKQDYLAENGKLSENCLVRRTPTLGPKVTEERLSRLFLSVGIPAHIKGYKYLRDAVKLVLGDSNIINSITKKLYPNIATINETSPSKVERAIRHAIEVAWTRGKLENLNKIFGLKVYSGNEKPTNGEFIALVADKILIDQAV